MPDINMQHFGELQRNQHSINVEIDASQVASPQQDFPMMLETPNSSNSILNVVAINELGEQLPTEIEGVANGKNWIYLKDLVQNVTNRKMKIFYSGVDGKPAADSTYGSEAVWDSNYSGIWHFAQDPDAGGSGDILDSTSNNNNGTAVNFGAGKLINGSYGKGIDFDGAQYIQTGITNFPSNYPLTLEAYFLRDSATSYGHVMIRPKVDASWTSPYALYGMEYTSTGVNLRFATTGLTDNVEVITAGNDVNIYICDVYDGSDKYQYMNDDSPVSTSYTTAIPAGGSYFFFGAASQATQYPFNGKLYEARVSNVDRSSDWRLTIYKNINNPTASSTNPFFKLISEELNFAKSLKSFGRAG